MGIKFSAGTIAFAIAAVAVGGYVTWSQERQRVDARNYTVTYESPKNWKKMPKGPQTLFLYKDPKSGLLLRGAQNQVIAELNPTPELDGPGLVSYYLERTETSLKGWTAKALDSVDGINVKFHLLRRERQGKVVLSAFGVRGNTTFIVTLSGNDEEAKQIDDYGMKFLRDYLGTIEFSQAERDEKQLMQGIPAVNRDAS